MTNKEYLQTTLSPFGIMDAQIDIILAKAGIDGAAQATDFTALDTALYHHFPPLFAGMASSVSEGGYSVTFNMEAVKAWYSWLARKLGLPDNLFPKPQAKGVSPW